MSSSSPSLFSSSPSSLPPYHHRYLRRHRRRHTVIVTFIVATIVSAIHRRDRENETSFITGVTKNRWVAFAWSISLVIGALFIIGEAAEFEREEVATTSKIVERRHN